MVMTTIDTQRSGIASASRKFSDNPRQLITKLVVENPGATKDELFPEFLNLIAKKDNLRRVIDWYFFANMYDYLVGGRNRPPPPPDRVARDAEVERLKARVVEVVLLNLVLPSGKMLRDATFAECAEAGGWYAKVATMGKPHQIVGKVLTERQLRRVKQP